MTFDELWPLLVIPGEFDAMDSCDQRRWRGVLEQAFNFGRCEGFQDAAQALCDEVKRVQALLDAR